MFVVCGEALFDLFPEETGDKSRLLFDARIGGSASSAERARKASSLTPASRSRFARIPSS